MDHRDGRGDETYLTRKRDGRMTASGQRAPKRDEPPRVISPDERRRLQARYAQAQSLMARSEYDFREVHPLLAGCLEVDPGNLRYIDLLLLNLKRRREAGTRPPPRLASIAP